MLVLVIMGLLAAIVVPQFVSVGDEAGDTTLRRDLQIVRNQIEFYRVKTSSDPELIVNQWGDLVFNNYLHSPPVNPLNQNVTVAAAPDANIGWVWRDSGSGRFDIYGTDATGLAEFIE